MELKCVLVLSGSSQTKRAPPSVDHLGNNVFSLDPKVRGEEELGILEQTFHTKFKRILIRRGER